MKKSTGLTAVLFAAFFMCACDGNFSSPGSAVSSSFEAHSMTVSSGLKINYFLYTPKNPSENLPLVLYLHGGSGKPDVEEGNLDLLTAGDGLPSFIKEKKIEPESYIVFPQLSYGSTGWSDMKTDLLSFVNSVAEELKCNKNKISITGHSMGGKGTWDIVLSYPASFYKAAPLSGNVTVSELNVSKLEHKPVWAFVGSDDAVVDPQSSIDFINALSQVNSSAAITVIEGYGHFDVPYVYLSDQYNLLAWLVQ